MWKRRLSASHYRTTRVKPAQHSLLSGFQCILFPPFNLNFTSLLLLFPHIFNCSCQQSQLVLLSNVIFAAGDRAVCSVAAAIIAEQGAPWTHTLSSVPTACDTRISTGLAACDYEGGQTFLCLHFYPPLIKVILPRYNNKTRVYICCLHSNILTPFNQSHPPLC